MGSAFWPKLSKEEALESLRKKRLNRSPAPEWTDPKAVKSYKQLWEEGNTEVTKALKQRSGLKWYGFKKPEPKKPEKPKVKGIKKEKTKFELQQEKELEFKKKREERMKRKDGFAPKARKI